MIDYNDFPGTHYIVSSLYAGFKSAWNATGLPFLTKTLLHEKYAILDMNLFNEQRLCRKL